MSPTPRLTTIALLAATLGAGVVTSVASATTQPSQFCTDAKNLTAVPTLALPTQASQSAINKSLNALSQDISQLQQDETVLTYMATKGLSTQVKTWYATANAAVASEITALRSVKTESNSLMNNPFDYGLMLRLGGSSATGAADAATANSYLSVAAPVSAALCKPHVTPTTTTTVKKPVKPKPKPKPTK